ncbi:helix-turn-helix domain-containing protein [Haloferula sp.]|uniref:helix-turn-helix domain-containing protein n=1 Tax=Haloferula sp. TaxID=2497595 RepID=UPI003C76D496
MIPRQGRQRSICDELPSLDPRFIPTARVSEVVCEVGFQSLSQFNRAFKRYAGMTASEVRESGGSS